MSRFADLHPDQQAALRLLLVNGLTYGKIAAVLGISEDDVRERAHQALIAIGGPLSESVDPAILPTLCDYRLDQLSPEERINLRSKLTTNQAARAWNDSVSGQISQLVPAKPKVEQQPEPIAASEPETEPQTEEPKQQPEPDATVTQPVSSSKSTVSIEDAFAEVDGKSRRQSRSSETNTKSKKSAAATLKAEKVKVTSKKRFSLPLAALLVTAIAAVVGGILLFGGNGSDDSPTTSTPTVTAGAGAAEQAAAAASKLQLQINFKAPNGSPFPRGIASPDVVADDKGISRAVVMFRGEGFKPITEDRRYSVWLTSKSGRAAINLGWLTNGVDGSDNMISKKGTISGIPFYLTKVNSDNTTSNINPDQYDEIVITSTAKDADTKVPGKTVVSGSLRKTS